MLLTPLYYKLLKLRFWLKNLPSKYLYSPWEAPLDILNEAGVTLGKNYPNPVVDLKESREKALDAFSVIRIK